jgi:hypothetical protein
MQKKLIKYACSCGNKVARIEDCSISFSKYHVICALCGKFHKIISKAELGLHITASENEIGGPVSLETLNNKLDAILKKLEATP